MKKEIKQSHNQFYIILSSINKPELNRFRKLVNNKECDYVIEATKKSNEKINSHIYVTKNPTYFNSLFEKFYENKQLYIGRFTYMGEDIVNKYGKEFYCYAVSEAEAFIKLTRQVADIKKQYDWNFYYNYFKCKGNSYQIYTMKNKEK